jgi:beta-glucosidase
VAPPKSSVPRPPRELKGFAKVRLEPGESRRVEIALRPSALAFFDQASQTWKADPGEYQILIGSSSRDIRLQARLTVPKPRTFDRY